MRSVISNHVATKEQVLQRINDVLMCGKLFRHVESGHIEIKEYYLGRYKYIITYINGSIVAFELENVYCFKF